jgi:hypothetical protein
MRRGAAILALALLALPAAASGAGIVFSPRALTAAKVGVRYHAVIRISVAGHHPALGKDYPSYTVACFGADAAGGYFDDCGKLPPGLRLETFEDPTCSPPLRKPACVAVDGTPRKAGTYTFRISAPDVASAGVRGIVRKYTIIVRPKQA